jgi:serine/threonine protein kinase
VAPEVSDGGISAATQASDVFALCATLAAVFEGHDARLAGAARNVLAAGLAAAPEQRASLQELARQLRDLLPKAEGQPLPPGVQVPPPQPECPPADYWCEGVEIPFGDTAEKTLRVLTRLGSGGVGRTFKVEHVDAHTGENYGTYVAKVIRTPEAGEAALRAYQRVRCHSVSPGLSAVFEVAPQWQPDRVVALLKWVDGKSLDGLRGVLGLAADEYGEESLESLLRRWLREVCSALSLLHGQRLVHGDVSPRNLIHHHGGLTLTDYDLVTPAGQSAWGVGARSYCSPEAERREPLLPSDDVFALAASLFETAFDHPPFPSPRGALDKTNGLDWRAGEKERSLNSSTKRRIRNGLAVSPMPTPHSLGWSPGLCRTSGLWKQLNRCRKPLQHRQGRSRSFFGWIPCLPPTPARRTATRRHAVWTATLPLPLTSKRRWNRRSSMPSNGAKHGWSSSVAMLATAKPLCSSTSRPSLASSITILGKASGRHRMPTTC